MVFLGASSFGILSTFVKKAYQSGYTLGEVTGVQVLFGMLLLWACYGLGKWIGAIKAKATRPNATPVWHIAASGFSTGLVSILYYQCVQLLPASIAIVLLMQYLWIGALINYLLYRITPSKMQAIGILVILFGTLVATGIFDSQWESLSATGILFGLGAASMYAVFLLVNGKIGNDRHPIYKSAWMISGACVLVFLIFPPTFLFNGSLGGDLLRYGLLISIFGTVIPPLFFSVGIPKTGYSLASILSAAELPVAVGMSYFVLKETVSGLQWTGVLLILLAIIVNHVKIKKLAKIT